MMKKQFKDALWCDCENDTDRANFIAMGRACETGIISKSIQSELVNVFNYRAGWSEERLGQLTRIAELEADIKLLEAGVVTVDGEREVLYGRIDELEQALEGGK